MPFVAENARIGLKASRLFAKYLERRPIDVAFLHLPYLSSSFIDQFMGRGKRIYSQKSFAINRRIAGSNALANPVCQLNIDLPLTSSVLDAQRVVDWFRNISTHASNLKQRYFIGYATTVKMGAQTNLRFYAFNVGQARCVAKFLDRSECRPLIGSIYDDADE